LSSHPHLVEPFGAQPKTVKPFGEILIPQTPEPRRVFVWLGVGVCGIPKELEKKRPKRKEKKGERENLEKYSHGR
jgi:hypothetical protein